MAVTINQLKNTISDYIEEEKIDPNEINLDRVIEILKVGEETCYKRLLVEMILRGITKEELSNLLNITINSLNKKFNGKSDFTYKEVRLIMRTYFENESVDYIFRNKRA